MNRTIRDHLARPGIRYIIIGGSVYLLELVIILVAERAGTGPVGAVALSFWIGLAVSFGLHKLVTFGDRRSQRRIVALQLVAYSGLVVFNFGFTLLCIELLKPFLATTLSRTIALAITVIWNFYLYQTRIFRPAAREGDA